MYKIDKTSATNMLTSIARYFSDEYDEWFATDIGDWVMEITQTPGGMRINSEGHYAHLDCGWYRSFKLGA